MKKILFLCAVYLPLITYSNPISLSVPPFGTGAIGSKLRVQGEVFISNGLVFPYGGITKTGPHFEMGTDIQVGKTEWPFMLNIGARLGAMAFFLNNLTITQGYFTPVIGLKIAAGNPSRIKWINYLNAGAQVYYNDGQHYGPGTNTIVEIASGIMIRNRVGVDIKFVQTLNNYEYDMTTNYYLPNNITAFQTRSLFLQFIMKFGRH